MRALCSDAVASQSWRDLSDHRISDEKTKGPERATSQSPKANGISGATAPVPNSKIGVFSVVTGLSNDIFFIRRKYRVVNNNPEEKSENKKKIKKVKLSNVVLFPFMDTF